MVDVLGDVTADAAFVRICAEDGPVLEAAFADGRWALAGVPADLVPTITLDVRDESTVRWRAGPVEVDDVEVDAPLAPCEDCEPCPSTGRDAPQDQSWVIGVRLFP